MTVLQQHASMDDVAEMNNHDEYGMLMSLALDDFLDGEGQALLEAHLAGCVQCQRRWNLWQSIDASFRAAAMTAPSPAFVHNFGQRLAAQERRQRLRLGILLGALTVVMWLIGMAGVAVVIGALIYNQVGWFTESLRWLAYVWTAISVIGRSLLALASGLVEEPSAIGLLAGYIVLAGGVLTVWSRYLRRSLRAEDIRSA